MTALAEEPDPHRLVSRKEAARVLRQVTTGIGAILLAAVDDWNALSQRHSAHLRTVLQSLGRGGYVAAMSAACTDVWLSTPGKHPPGHLVSKPHKWPMISSRGKTYMAIHHNETEPTNARRTAFCTQDSETLRLIDSQTLSLLGDATHCEITWEYHPVTDLNIRTIWVSAPSVDWDRFEVPMARAQSQLDAWRKREMKWLPGALPTDANAAALLPIRDTGEDLKPGIEVRPPQRSEDTRDAQ